MKSTQDYQKAADILKEQEEKLQLDRFDNQEAWKLGNFIANKMIEEHQPMGVCIRRMSGSTMFQYLNEGATHNNENWMRRKFNTVCYFEKSSLRACVNLVMENSNAAAYGLSDADYKLCGGGFPLRVKGADIVAVLVVSGLPHEEDHAFMVRCLSEYLKVDVPQVTGEIEMP